MSRKFPEGLAVGSGRGGEVLLLDPTSDKLIVDEKKFNVSRWEPVDDDAVRGLAEAIVRKGVETKQHGQLSAIRVRKLDAENYAVAAGFTRAKALRLINTDKNLREALGLGEGEIYPLRCEVVSQNEDNAVLDNIDENLERNELTPMDKANIVAILRTRGWETKTIAERFGWTVPWVGQLEKLLTLDAEHQKSVHRREIGASAAIALLDIPAEERNAVLEQAAADRGGKLGKINGATINRAKREKALAQAEKTGATATNTAVLSIREIRKFLEQHSDKEAEHPEEIRDVYKTFLGFVNGKKTGKQVVNAMNRLAETKVSV